MEIFECSNGVEVTSFGEINLKLTLDCGQCFRWKENPDGSFSGIAHKKEVKIRKTDNGLLFEGTSIDDVKSIWANYFDLEYDYSSALKRLSSDEIINTEYNKHSTVRILNQEPFEALCSFIISSCNNIPRIKKIVDTLCENFGEHLGSGYSFPSPDTLAVLSVSDLAVLKVGYRDVYIMDAAEKVSSGEIDFDYIRTLSLAEAEKELMKIKGVGKKVADCTLLFSLGFKDCFPVDRHVKRAVGQYYPSGLPEFFSPDSGLAQQYIFYKMQSEATANKGLLKKTGI